MNNFDKITGSPVITDLKITSKTMRNFTLISGNARFGGQNRGQIKSLNQMIQALSIFLKPFKYKGLAFAPPIDKSCSKNVPFNELCSY